MDRPEEFLEQMMRRYNSKRILTMWVNSTMVASYAAAHGVTFLQAIRLIRHWAGADRVRFVRRRPAKDYNPFRSRN